MKKQVIKTLSLMIVMAVLFMIAIPCITYAALPVPPTPPNLPSSSGSDGSPIGGSSTAKFQPYVIELKSTDGTVIGNISVQDYSLAKLRAEKKVKINNITYVLQLTGDLESAPSSPMLDITSGRLADSGDADLAEYAPIASFNITRYSKGGDWSMKRGSMHLTITCPEAALDGIAENTPVFLVKNDTKRTITYETSMTETAGNNTAITALLWYEPQSPSGTGTYTLIGNKVQTVSPVSTEKASISQAPAVMISNTSPQLLIVALIAGIIIGISGAVLFLIMVRKK